MTEYETEIEGGLSFARAQLSERLRRGDLSNAADLALATLALVAARDAQSAERPTVLKFPGRVAPRRSPERRDVKGAASILPFEEEAAKLRLFPRAQRRESNVVPVEATPLKLYCGD